MCLLIFSPDISKSKIDIDDLKRGFDKNDDGAGLAYVRNGKVIIDKGYFKFKSFKNAYERIVRTIEGPLMIHFRMATAGKIDYVNSHPMFIYEDELCVGHNGVFSELSYKDSEISDTVRLANLLQELGWTYPYNEAQSTMIDVICGGYNKLVFLDNKGNYNIVNEDAGTWKKDTWYSNTLSFPYIPTVYNNPHASVYPNSWRGKDWEELTEAEIEEFCWPDENSPIGITTNIEVTKKNDPEPTFDKVHDVKREDISDQEKKVDEYMEKYPDLFAPGFKEKRLAKMKASKIIKMPLALPSPQSALPSFCPLPGPGGTVIPINDPSSQYYKRD